MDRGNNKRNKKSEPQTTWCSFAKGEQRRQDYLFRTFSIRAQLAYDYVHSEYFDGKRKIFDLPLKPEGTEFQLKDWNALREIPYGETRSYKDIAIAIGNPKACRAVGTANHNNPISIIIPCHRVIGSDGSLTGYGGGLDKKTYLLELEQKNRP